MIEWTYMAEPLAGAPRERSVSMNIAYHINERKEIPDKLLSLAGPEVLAAAQRFHSAIPGYQPTPLVPLDHLAQKLGVFQVLVKDESKRFGLNAFKALGGSYAIARCLAQRLGWSEDQLSFQALMAPEVHEKLGTLTFVTATDGNHGRGVAWAARQLGHRAVVYMPKGSARERLENIRAQGAQAEITDLNYDDAVRLADQMAKRNSWILVQDTAWPGYEEIPTWIMQGYTTIARELFAQIPAQGWLPPTHLFLQAGVGSFAGAMTGSFVAQAKALGVAPPTICIVEPDQADCLYRSANAGTITPVTGDMNSMMAGLCCGEPCTITWPLIHSAASAFVSCSDEYAAAGMRLLGRPEAGDPAIISGESGAVTAGVLSSLFREEKLAGLRQALGLNETSRILCISTEGDTDQANYQAVLSAPEAAGAPGAAGLPKTPEAAGASGAAK